MSRTRQSVERELAQRRHNLNKLKERAAKFGTIRVPLPLSNEIEDEEKAIAELKELLESDKLPDSLPIPFVDRIPIWIWGIFALMLVGLGVGVWFYFFRPPFPPAAKDETLIIVTTFDDRSGEQHPGEDPAQYIYDKLRDEIQDKKLDIRLEHFGEAVGEARRAREIGESYGATLVVWGYYTASSVQPTVEIIEKWERESLSPELPLDISQPDDVRFCLIVDLPAHANYLTLFTVGLAHYRAGEMEKALKCFTAAIEAISPGGECYVDVSEAHFYRGTAYLLLGDHERAIEDYDQAIALKPELAEAYNNRGGAYYYLGDYERAIANFDQAIALQPDYAEAYSNRGATYNGLDDHKRAIADCDKAIELKPDYAEAYNNRGNAYANLGDYERAITDYNKAIELQPDYAKAYNGRGSAYYHQGDYEQALADYDKAIELQPDLCQSLQRPRGRLRRPGRSQTGYRRLRSGHRTQAL